MKLYDKYNTLLNQYGINTKLRTAHFMAQIEAESGLNPKRESLYFTKISGLRNTFKTPFLNKTDLFVVKYLKDSVKCANYVYANRGGNGNEASGDGYKFRGGGLLQNTFHDGYKWLTEKTGIDFITNPDLILEESNAMIASLEFWKANNLNKYADLDDLDAISDQINLGRQTDKYGDANGFEHRKEFLLKYKNELK